MFKSENRNYLMKMENFTQNLSHSLLKKSVFGFLLGLMLISTQSYSQTCPLACNNNVQVSMDSDCMVEITPDMMLEGQGTDPDCDYFVVVLGSNNQPIAGNPNVGSQYIGQTLTVEVRLGNNKCWGRIKVEDKLPPIIDCPATDTVDCYSTIGFTNPPATDNCGNPVTVTVLSNEVVDETCDGDITAVRTIRYQAKDRSGNLSRVCERVIVYRKIGLDDIVIPANKDDVEDPALPCSNDPEWDLNDDGYPQPNESGVPTTLDGFPVYPNNAICELNATFTDQRINICQSSFKVLRHWTVLDWCSGEIVQEYQIIKVIDKDGPTLTCPPDGQGSQVVSADPYNCTGTWYAPDPTVIYDCSSTSYTVSYLLADNNGNPPVNGVYIDDNVVRVGNRYEIRNLPVGRTWIRYTVTDACGNVSYCFTEVDVIDNVPPTAVCDEFTVVTLTNNSSTQGIASIFATTFDDGSHDNCTDVTLGVRRMTPGCGQSTSTYADRVQFCCQDVGRPITVELRVTDANNLSNTCMVTVNVQDKTDPVITCPSNVTINCDVDYMNTALTGNATAIDNCGNPSVTFRDSGSPNQCGVGTINRTFTATISGVSKTCTQRITIVDNNPFKSSDINWTPIRDVTINGCMDVDTDPSVTGMPTWTSDDCSLIASSYTDQVFTLVDSVCFKILRTWTIIDWCQFNQSNPQAGGLYSRTQIIKLNNRVKPTFMSCSDKTADGFGENCDGFISLINPVQDDCTPTNKLKVTYRIDDFADGTYGPVRNGTDASGTYPVGRHKILWTVEDLCGNRNTCEHFFTIVDKKKPTPYCLGEITTVIMPSSLMIDVWASDFDKGSFDNCPGRVRLSFSQSVTDTQRVFTCDDLGINTLQMWVTDAAGNKDFCTVRINIQSNGDGCDGTRIAGRVSTDDNRMIENVKVELVDQVTKEAMEYTTNKEGLFEFTGMEVGNSYTIKNRKDDNYLNGVSTLDLVMIQRHILGIEKLNNPYKTIAADVNNSQNVTASDLVELRKLILGIIKELPKNDSWRFVSGEQQFPIANNPWPFEEYIDLQFAGADMLGNNFMAVKIGDVNNSAKANLRDSNTDNRSDKKITLTTNDKTFTYGELVNVAIAPSVDAEIIGFQMAFTFDADMFDFVGIEAVQAEMTESNINLSQVGEGIVFISWNEATAKRFESTSRLFDVLLTAKSSATIAGNIGLGSQLKGEAYNDNLETMDIKLEVKSASRVAGIELLQNSPNPFDRSTTVKFVLPTEKVATFKVVDITGKELMNMSKLYPAGENMITISADQIPVSGILYYSLEVDGLVSTKKMILIKE